MKDELSLYRLRHCFSTISCIGITVPMCELAPSDSALKLLSIVISITS